MKKTFLNLAELKQEQIRWLWPNRIPLGAITVIEGNPGDAKTTLLLDIVARATAGRPMFNCDGQPSPMGALLILGEDHLESVVVPRLIAARTARCRVRAYDASTAGEEPLRLPKDIGTIEREAAEVQARLIVIDPIAAFFDGNIHSDQSVRKVMGPLTALAERTGASVVIVRHLNKAGGRPLYRGGGSIGIIAAARSGLLVARSPADPDQRILAQFKSSYGRTARSLAFAVRDKNSASTIEWIGESHFTADDLTDLSSGDDRTELQNAIFTVFSILAEGPLLAKVALKLIADAGVSPATCRRAKKILGIAPKRKGFGPGSRFYWKLPSHNELLAKLRENEMDNLIERLYHESDDDDRADWWKHGGQPNDDDTSGA